MCIANVNDHTYTQAELQQLHAPADLHNVISPRNEAATIANLVALWRHDGDCQALLHELHQHTDMQTRRWTSDGATACTDLPLPSTTVALMHTVEQHHGVNTGNCQPAMFDGMRGMACRATLQPGDTVVCIPKALLIHDGIASASDLVYSS